MRPNNLLVFIVLVITPASLYPAIVSFTGFESGSTIEAAATSGTLSIQTSTKRTGDYGLRVNPTTTNVGYFQHTGRNGATGLTLNENDAETFYRFYFQYATKPLTGTEDIAQAISTANTTKFSLRISSDGVLAAYDSAGASLSTGTTVLAASTWYRIEMKVGTGAAADWEVRINGVSELSGTGNLLTSNNAVLRMGKVVNRNGNSVDFFYDDAKLDNSAYPAESEVKRMDVDSDGSFTAWTIGTGAGDDYTNLDEVPTDGNTTHLISLTPGNVSTAGLESTSAAGVSGTVNAVLPVTYSTMDSANSTATVRFVSGGSNFHVSPTVAGGARMIGRYYSTDPATGSAWVLSALDSVEVGMVEGSSLDETRFSTAHMFVDYVPSTGRRRVILAN